MNKNFVEKRILAIVLLVVMIVSAPLVVYADDINDNIQNIDIHGEDDLELLNSVEDNVFTWTIPGDIYFDENYITDTPIEWGSVVVSDCNIGESQKLQICISSENGWQLVSEEADVDPVRYAVYANYVESDALSSNQEILSVTGPVEEETTVLYTELLTDSIPSGSYSDKISFEVNITDEVNTPVNSELTSEEDTLTSALGTPSESESISESSDEIERESQSVSETESESESMASSESEDMTEQNIEDVSQDNQEVEDEFTEQEMPEPEGQIEPENNTDPETELENEITEL